MLNTNEVRIETCTECNYSCIFCPHSNKFTRKKEIMHYDKFIFIVNKLKKELPNITDITISGFGEAFMDDTIIEKIAYAKSMGYKIHVLTNGYYIPYPRLDKLNKIGIEDIRVSLHSILPDAYKKLTRAPLYQFNSVMWNIDYIIKKTAIPLILTFEIIDGINDDQIESIKRRYSNVATLEMWRPHNWVDAFKFRKGDSIRSTCGRPWNSPYQIQVDGTVNMCCFDYNGKLYLGDFLTQTMKQIFEGEKYITLKELHEGTSLDDSKIICRSCDQRKDQSDIIVYNNKFKNDDRLNRTSTNYTKI